MTKINFKEKFALFDEVWTPKVLAQSNGQLIKIAKGEGELVWHSHEQEDELFIVVKGELIIRLRDETITLLPGEMYVVPKGVEHSPLANKETHFIMIEPKSTKHTGSLNTEVTVTLDNQEWI